MTHLQDQNLSLACIIASYEPDDSLISLVHAISKQNAHCIIVDNASSIQCESILTNLEGLPNCHLIRLSQNAGLAAVQNLGIAEGQKLQCDWFMFFDQDSQISNTLIHTMLESYQELKTKENIGILGANYLDYNTNLYGKYAKLNFLSFESVRFKEGHAVDYEEVSFVLSSGSLMHRSLFEKIGLFENRFFIDNIDTEYCLRVKRAGYTIKVNTKAILQHSVGHRTVHRLLGFLRVKPNHHPASRKYTITRNGLKTIAQYWAYKPSFVILMLSRLFHDILGIVFYEKQKTAKLWGMTKGFFHSLVPLSRWQKFEIKIK